MSRLLTTAVLSLLFLTTARAESGSFHLEAYPLAGTWESKGVRYHVTYWGDSPYLIRAADGKAWNLEQADESPSLFRASGLGGNPAGSLTLEGQHSWRVSPGDQSIQSATRVRFAAEEFVVRNGDESELHGTIVWPQQSPPRGMILYLNGEGPNPRTDVLPTALALLEAGLGAVMFDQRHAGDSTGKENKGNYYDRSLRAASDATAVSTMVTNDPRFANLPVGTLGWSQGGWIGAIVVRRNADLDFHVCVAGNAAPGWEQWRHSMKCRLIRAGVVPDDLRRADLYFDAFFGVMRGVVDWDRYAVALEVAQEEEWWPVMKRRNVAEWETDQEAREYWSQEKQNVPANDFESLDVPTLGVFFEFDASTTPDSPGVFATALTASEAPAFSVVQLRGLQHGSWVVEGYADSASRFSTRSQVVNMVVADWILLTIGGQE